MIKEIVYKPETDQELYYFGQVQKLKIENKSLRIEIGKLKSEIDYLNSIKEIKTEKSKRQLIKDSKLWQCLYFTLKRKLYPDEKRRVI